MTGTSLSSSFSSSSSRRHRHHWQWPRYVVVVLTLIKFAFVVRIIVFSCKTSRHSISHEQSNQGKWILQTQLYATWNIFLNKLVRSSISSSARSFSYKVLTKKELIRRKITTSDHHTIMKKKIKKQDIPDWQIHPSLSSKTLCHPFHLPHSPHNTGKFSSIRFYFLWVSVYEPIEEMHECLFREIWGGWKSVGYSKSSCNSL